MSESEGTYPSETRAERRELEYLSFVAENKERRQRSLQLLRRWDQECKRIYLEEGCNWSPTWHDDPAGIDEECTIVYDETEIYFADQDGDGDSIAVTMPTLFFIDPERWERELRVLLRG